MITLEQLQRNCEFGPVWRNGVRSRKTFQKHLSDTLPFLEIWVVANPKDDAELSPAANTKPQQSVDLLADCEVFVGVVKIGQSKGVSVGEAFESQIFLSLLLKNVLSAAMRESLRRSICHGQRTAKLLMKADQWR